MTRGDNVKIELAGREMRAIVVLASKNEDSLMLEFDGMLGGYVISMPLLRGDDGEYRDLIEGRIVKVTKL